MIVTYLLQFIKNIVLMVFSIFPDVTLNANVSSAFSSMILTWNSVTDTFPYIDTLMIAFGVIVAFELGIQVINFFLGSHSLVKTL